MVAKRQLLLELLARDSTGPATKGAADNLDHVAESAEGAAKATDNLGEQAEQSTEHVERFGKSNKTAAEHAVELDHEIKNVEQELHQLAVAFAEAQTAADRTDLSKAMRRTQSDLRNLNKSKSLIEDLVPSEAEIGQEFQKLAPSFGKQISELFSSAGEMAGPALGAALAVSAPAIAATISGAVIGGAGVGGIVGGLLMTKSDPRVASALTAFTGQLKTKLSSDAGPFVDVWLNGIQEIEGALDGIDFKGLFGDAAKEAGPLIHGVAEAVGELGHGITDLIHNAGPAVQAIGQGIGDFGRTVGQSFSMLAQDGPQAADALRNLFTIINLGTESVFSVIDGLTQIYGWLRKIGGPGIIDLGNMFEQAKAPISGVVKSIAEQAMQSSVASTTTDQYGHAILTAGDAIESFTDKVDRLTAAGHSLFDTTTQVGAAIDTVAKAAKNSRAGLDANTAAGRTNREALSSLASALTDNYDAYVKVNGEGRQSNQIAASNRAQFIKLATQFTHSRAAAEALADEMGLIPAKKETDFTANTHGAAANIASLQAQIDRLHGKQIELVVAASISNKVQNTLDRFGGARAGGGPVRRGQAYVVGEHRPELFVPDSNGTILPSVPGQAGGGTVVVDIRGGSDDLKRLIRSWIRTDNLLNT